MNSNLIGKKVELTMSLNSKVLTIIEIALYSTQQRSTYTIYLGVDENKIVYTFTPLDIFKIIPNDFI